MSLHLERIADELVMTVADDGEPDAGSHACEVCKGLAVHANAKPDPTTVAPSTPTSNPTAGSVGGSDA